ncbi:hypothetical protein [Chryseobacterium foetidum]|uniref:hypothetical protein n=1 Tax=Chryseobacterium foetidum TaxID=2951057 RepID=UPI0021C74FD4|nr:hypothetical protein [Chryseobacterium foetidum]
MIFKYFNIYPRDFFFLFMLFISVSGYSQCPTSIVYPASADGSVATTVINNGDFRIGSSKMTIENSSAVSFTNVINTSHQTERSINIGHSGSASTFNNRVETILTFSQPVYNLNFNINDLDAGDRIRILAYNQNNNLINFGTSNFTLSSGTVITYTASPDKEFSSAAVDVSSSNSNTTARIAINFNSSYVSRLVLQYYDTNSSGSYTIANIAGASLCAQNDSFGSVQLGTATASSVLTNDLSSTGVTASAANTNVTLINLGGLTGATINANGTINIPANATPGNYTLTYRICSPTDQTNFCTTATVSLTVLTCQAGTAPPTLVAGGFYDATNSAYRIPCGSTTANLSTITSSNKPTPATVTLTWHTGTPATTANKILAPTALTGTNKYYASFFDSVANCYSPTKEIVVFAPICGRNNDFTSIPITAGVGGTLPSIFANDSYNGLAIADISTITADFDYELWTPSNAIINDNGTLTIPAGVPPGIYTYYYKLVDTDPDVGTLINEANFIEVKFRVSPNSDGDAYNDYDDWDDDNDGILDAVESPPCFYSAAESSVIENITSPFIGAAGDPTAGNSIATLYNGNTSDANPFNFTGQTITSGSPIFTISYPAIIRLTSLSVNQAASGMAPANRFGRLFGSNDGVNFTAISNGVALNSATVTFAVTSTTSYRFYEIRYVGTVAAGNLTDGTLGTANIQEITAVYNLLAYEPSANPKPITCTFSTDSDGIPNHLDPDSDGDNCFDAVEGGENVTSADVDSNGRITGGVDANGVPNLVNSGGAADTGSSTEGTLGQPIGQSQDAFRNDCLDSDGDTIPDWQDLDNDNDGILNKNECIGFIANNVSGPWKGRTASNITVTANPGTTQSNSIFVITDPQVNYSINQNGGDQRFGNASTSVSYVLTFSTPVPASEIGLMIDDVNVGSGFSPSATYKIDVDFGSGFVNPQGAFVKTLAGRNSGVGYNPITGVPSFQDLPNPVGEDIYLRGAGNRLVKAVRITGLNLGTGDSISYSFFALSSCDTDGDGIPNDLDLDSDNDGCSDAIEGSSTTITNANLVNSSMPGGNTGATSGNYNQPVIQNLGNSVDTTPTSPSYGVPSIAGTGQGVGDSANSLVNSCVCYEDPTLVAGATYPVKHGITLLGRAGKISAVPANGVSDWPMNKNSAYTVLESKTKGFVVTRNSSPETTITIPVVGMMVFDTDENAGAGCLKIYTGPGSTEGWKCFSTQGCP